MRVYEKDKMKSLFFSKLNKNRFSILWSNIFLSEHRVSNLQATQCSDTICSGPALKMARSLCIVQISGSNRLHTQFHDEYHNKGQIITRMIQINKVIRSEERRVGKDC